MRLIRPFTALALLMAGLGLNAQAPDWTLGFRMHGGPTSGALKTAAENGGYTFGLAVEAGWKLDKQSSVIGQLGYAWLPGDNRLVSKYEKALPATGVNPTHFEMRNRKTDLGGFQLAALYRYQINEDIYLEGGLRLGFNRAVSKDNGTRITTNGNAVVDVTKPADANILAIATIVEEKTTNTTSIGPVVGAGLRLTEDKFLGFSLSSLKVNTPYGGSATGMAAELSFTVRF